MRTTADVLPCFAAGSVSWVGFMVERTGLAAIVHDAGAGDGIDSATQAEQLDMLGLTMPENRRVPGRPAGRRNLRNQRIAGYLLAKYRDPLEGLVAMAGLGVEELAAVLGCSKAEAWAEKRLCAVAALPYLHQRQPLAVDMTARQVVHLTITDGADLIETGEAEADAMILDHADISEAFQDVSDRQADDV